MQEFLTNYTVSSADTSLTKAFPMNKPKSIRGEYILFPRMHWASHMKMNGDTQSYDREEAVVGKNNLIYHTMVF